MSADSSYWASVEANAAADEQLAFHSDGSPVAEDVLCSLGVRVEKKLWILDDDVHGVQRRIGNDAWDGGVDRRRSPPAALLLGAC